MGHSMSHNIKQQISIEDCAKDGGKEFLQDALRSNYKSLMTLWEFD